MSLELDDLEFVGLVRCADCGKWFDSDQCKRVYVRGVWRWVCQDCAAAYKEETND